MKTKFIIMPIIICCIFSCKSQYEATISYPYRYSTKDSITIYLEHYEVDSSLYALLDSIIESSKECFESSKTKCRFLFNTYSFEGDSLLYVSIVSNNAGNYNVNFAKYNGLFYYKNNRFLYQGKLLDTFFTRKGEVTPFRCVDPKKVIIDIDDTSLYWKYKYINNHLYIIHFLNCDIKREYSSDYD